MKKINLLIIFLLLAFLGAFVPPVFAQDVQPGQLISVNSPISPELRSAVTAWLETSPPSSAVYYAITYTQPVGLDDTYVSLVGLNIETPDAFWSIVGDEEGNQQVIWMDTIRVYEDGTITFPFRTEQARAFKMANPLDAPLSGAGGGGYVRFPWQPGKAVQYGVLGVHAAEFGTDETWGAVDLISGDDMGSGAANDNVYASVAGEITYICDYEDTVAVRVVGSGDSFLYAHLLPNANLVLNHSFQAGQMMGTLKHGSFVDECGNAIQKANHWHLHWGFVTTGSSPKTFQAEGCIMKKSAIFTSGVWSCGDTDVKVLGYLYHYGNIGVNPDDGTVGLHGVGGGGGPSFWTYLLTGVSEIFHALFLNSLPEHSSTTLQQFITPMMSGIKIVFRITQVLIRGNFNLAPAMMILGAAIVIRLLLAPLQMAAFILRLIKSIPWL